MNEGLEKNCNTYNGDLIVDTFMYAEYLIVRCQYSVYRVNILTQDVMRLL